MSSDETRAALLVELIERSRDPREVAPELAALGWDSESTLCEVEARHVRREIGGFINGELAASDVEAWADAVEVRDDLELRDACGPPSHSCARKSGTRRAAQREGCGASPDAASSVVASDEKC